MSVAESVAKARPAERRRHWDSKIRLMVITGDRGA